MSELSSRIFSADITLRWHLSFCRRCRVQVSVPSARDFIACAQEEKRAQDWQVAGLKEAINWFFREAKNQVSGSRPNGDEVELVPPNQTAKEKPGPDLIPDTPHLEPAWKTAFLKVRRRRHYSYRTEQSHLAWRERFAWFCKSDDLQQRGPEEIRPL
jgi:hypothetical protein